MSVTLKPEATRAVVLVDGVARVAFNEDGSLELLTPISGTPTGNAVPTAGQMGIGKMWESAPQTIAAAAQVILDHPLGRVPNLIEFDYVCTTAHAGYSIGDIFPARSVDFGSSTTAQYGFSVVKTSTQLTVRTASSGGWLGLHKDTGAVIAAASIAANFKLVLRVWA